MRHGGGQLSAILSVDQCWENRVKLMDFRILRGDLGCSRERKIRRLDLEKGSVRTLLSRKMEPKGVG